MKKGFLISFEGGEGCGKSTQIKKFVKYLEDNKFDFLCTREPGGTEVGEKIREILLMSKENLSSETEFLLFSASRRKLLEDVVCPALESGKIVVLDRFFDSSYTYQGYAGSLNLKDIKNITDFATSKLKPDLTILLDLPVEVGMNRKSKDEKLKNLDRIESKGMIYHENVRKGYLTLAKKNKKRIFVVDAAQSVETVFEKIKNEFERRYKKTQN